MARRDWIVDSLLVRKGEMVYGLRRESWEKLYPDKIIAIDVETGRLVVAGETLDEVCEEVMKEYPGKQFYFRKVGPCPATSYSIFKG